MTGAVEWLTSTGAPNWVVLLAILTQPAAWSSWVRQTARERFGFPPRVDQEDGAVDGADQEGDAGEAGSGR